MNVIQSFPVGNLGYNFIEGEHLPEGCNEYHLRNIQNKDNLLYRPLSTQELDTLILNRNTSDNWNNVLVSENFDSTLVKNCKFFGLVRIGSLQPLFKEFHTFRMPVGLYNSTIISCDLGNNVCIDNVRYLSHYIIDHDVMIANVNELATTNYSKFGNGIVKNGEQEKVRTWIEVCNENGGRSILPFNGMLPGDAYLWSKYRTDDILMEKFKSFTQKTFDSKRGYYGFIGARTVIKNCGIIKDVWIGTDAYLKGANKIKNVTINSDGKRKSQVGEGCELVNGIVGFGCRIFYGVKAVRFVLASHSQLKYGARLINSYLGNNSTISCCEVLNSLIFPSHEQHHNNSFLCAALIMGQSNMAAGATVGSNHNSRSADGELQAGRGFWPGLCVSLKHNSKFASYTLMAKGDFPAELNISLPFTLVSNDVSNNKLVLMPAYWFMYNMYALERNAWKSKDRDKRTEKIQRVEFDYLAPDTINEVFHALSLLRKLEPDEDGNAISTGFENSTRPVVILKLKKSIEIYEQLIVLYAGLQLLNAYKKLAPKDFATFKKNLVSRTNPEQWLNIGGQLMREEDVKQFFRDVHKGTIDSWESVHEFYRQQDAVYENNKLQHAYHSYLTLKNITGKQFTATLFHELLEDVIRIKTWMCAGIVSSRQKDYSTPYRKMVYDTQEEMDKVLGKFEDNGFIQDQLAALENLKAEIHQIKAGL